MQIFLFNNSFTEQAQRQMETIVSFLEWDKIIVDKRWKNKIEGFEPIKHMDIEEFVRLRGRKAIIFLNIIDGYRLRKYKHIEDIFFIFRPRGLLPEESYYKSHNIIKKVILNYIEYKVIKDTDYFIFLNDKQKEHFLLKYSNLQVKLNKCRVLPNVKVMNSNLVRLEGSDSTIRIVYSGGFSKWQNIELVFEVASSIILGSNFDCVFTILTFEENFEKAKRLANYYNIMDNVVLKYVNPNELDKELISHDIGIIIRNNSIINLAASPFKVADYVSNGLGLIITQNIEEQVKDMLSKKHYFVIDYEKEELFYSEEELNKFISNMNNVNKKMDIINHYKKYISSIKKLEF